MKRRGLEFIFRWPYLIVCRRVAQKLWPHALASWSSVQPKPPGDSSSSYTDEYVTRCTSNLRMVYGRIKKRAGIAARWPLSSIQKRTSTPKATFSARDMSSSIKLIIKILD